MANIDYPDIEPIGGTADGGRDALFINRNSGDITVFAYSARVDWEKKLREDCSRIAKLDIEPTAVVFVSTQVMSAQQKDRNKVTVHEDYGWSLIYFDVERIRVLLGSSLKPLLSKHPSIFVSPWFERRGGELVSYEQRDLVIIDHVYSDHAFANWLFRKLTLLGYSVWCHGLAPLAGENADASVRMLVKLRATRYLPVLSVEAIKDGDLLGRMAVAAAEEYRTLPCWVSNLTGIVLGAHLDRLIPARFYRGWSPGLSEVVKQLEHDGVAKPLELSIGRRVALKAYMTEPLLKAEPEFVYANEFSVKVPEAIRAYELEHRNARLSSELEQKWAYVRSGKWVLSFVASPSTLPLAQPNPVKYAWREFDERFGLKSENLIKMLVKRSLFVACRQVGFRWCEERYTFYLHEEKKKRHGYQHVDGAFTNISFTGKRSWGWDESKTHFTYQLGPIFRVRIDEIGAVWVALRFYVRITDKDGTPLPTKMIPSRRKRVTKNWWNRQWLQRTLGMMQFIAGDGADIDGEIVVGDAADAVVVKVKPLTWKCPVGIDVEALDRVGGLSNRIGCRARR